MSSDINLILLYPYPYKTFAVIFGAIVLIIIGLPIYGIYRLIIRRMTERGKEIFHRVLIVSGICVFVIFFAEGALALITQHQVNRQLGFKEATSETPEGEPFLITRVVPGGVMAKAGLKPEDQVLMDSTSKLYKILIKNQGREVEFMVLRDNKEIMIRVMVPEMDLPLRSVTFFY